MPIDPQWPLFRLGDRVVLNTETFSDISSEWDLDGVAATINRLRCHGKIGYIIGFSDDNTNERPANVTVLVPDAGLPYDAGTIAGMRHEYSPTEPELFDRLIEAAQNQDITIVLRGISSLLLARPKGNRCAGNDVVDDQDRHAYSVVMVVDDRLMCVSSVIAESKQDAARTVVMGLSDDERGRIKLMVNMDAAKFEAAPLRASPSESLSEYPSESLAVPSKVARRPR